MIKMALGSVVRRALIRIPTFSISNKLSPEDYNSEQQLDMIDWRALVQADRKNVMKNYETILPGIYIRSQHFEMERQEIWETRSKRHRHAKLKRNKRKGPRKTVITNN